MILFTLTPQAESTRKPLACHKASPSGNEAELFAKLIEHAQGVCVRLPDADLLVATESPIQLRAGADELRQRGTSFGESLRMAVEDAFELGYRRVVVIGNDAPEITASYLARALLALSHDGTHAVIGAAADGGYNLLGLTRACAEAFDEIPWGTGCVAQLTTERLERGGFDVTHLPTLADIDDWDALNRFVRRARSLSSRDEHPSCLRALASTLATLIGASRGLATPDWVAHLSHTRISPAHPRRGPPSLA